MTLSLSSATLKGTVSPFDSKIAFKLESADPISPYVGAPKVVSASIVKEASLGEYAIVVKWNRPVHGWDFGIVQGTNSLRGYSAADEDNMTYSPTTHTYTIPILASAGLASGSCTLTLEEPDWTGGTPSWLDPYGAPAWATPSEVYTKVLTAP